MNTAVSPPVGQLLGGRYHVGSLIARGGMASVYLGMDTRLDRVVAIKIAHPDVSDDAEFVRRFISEARSAARLSSPNVVAVYDQGSDGRLHYIAMEYVPGRTLRQLLNERGRLDTREALDIMSGVLAGLAAAHQAGFAHRDVKPENVLLTPSGVVKVADFGLARAVAGAVQTKSGMIIGTAAYLAPEQVSGGTSDARTDVYAAGIMLYEMLTGSQPHVGDSPLAVAYKHVHESVQPPSAALPGLPASADALVAMATSRDPKLRPADAGQFLQALAGVHNGPAGPQGGGPTADYVAAGYPDHAYPADHRGYADGYDSTARYDHDGHSYGQVGYAQPPQPYNEAGYDGYDNSGYAYDGHQHVDAGDLSYQSGPSGWNPRAGSQPAYPHRSAWDERDRGVAGASALPSLPPQSPMTGPPAAGNSPVQHTLVVRDGGLPPGYGTGYDQRQTGSEWPTGQYGPPRQGGRSGRRVLYLIGTLVVLAGAALAGWWLMVGQYTTVPALRGEAVSIARTELGGANLTIKVASYMHSTLPKGEVVATSPAGGSRVKGGSVVNLTVSLGPLNVEVPNVSGQPLQTAKAHLRAAHLKVGKVTAVTSATVPVGQVITTHPAAYATRPAGTSISLTVSAGPPLPNFVGQQVQAAEASAHSGGYTINAVQSATGSQPANTITSQSPAPGTPITPGEVVTVHYSPGPPTVQVPDVRGMSVNQAIAVLQQAGFRTTVVQRGPGTKVGSYSPSGAQPKGSVITVYTGLFSGF